MRVAEVVWLRCSVEDCRNISNPLNQLVVPVLVVCQPHMVIVAVWMNGKLV